jgi:hypothetical protein
MRAKTVTSRRGRRDPRKHRAKTRPPRIQSGGLPLAVVVLGMHRSGTSAYTRVFGLLGADLPKILLPDNPTNPTGHWESNTLMTIHEEILSSGGSSWDDWRAFNPDWFNSPRAASFKTQILNVLRNDFANSQLFLIKDPRICRLWPLWRDVLTEFGAKPLIVLPVRNPLEVAASLKQRDNIIPAKAHLLWLRHVLDAEMATRGLPRVVTAYESLLDDWKDVTSTVAAELGLSWPRNGAMVEIEVEQFLSAQLRHHAFSSRQLGENSDVVDWVREAYAALRNMMKKPEHQASIGALDRVRATFEQASAAFGVTLAAGEIELAKRDTDVIQLAKDLEVAHASLREGETTVAAHERKIAELEHHRDELAVTLEETVETAAQNGLQASVLKNELETLRNERNELETLRDEVIRLRAESDALKSVSDGRKAEIIKLTNDLATVQTELRERDQDVHRLSHDVTSARAFLRESQSSTQRLAGDLDDAKVALSEASRELIEMRSRAEWLQKNCDELHLTASQFAAVREEITSLNALRETFQAAIGEHETAAIQLRREIDRKERQINDLSNETHVANETNTQIIRALRDQLVEAETALAKARRNERKGLYVKLPFSSSWLAKRQLIKSGLFDPDWYLREYLDVTQSGRAPIEHYLEEGYLHGYRPNPLFDTRWYLERYEDVRRSGINPLIHYLIKGAAEGRDPGPGFDTNFYLATNQDVRDSGENALAHYLLHGRYERRRPLPSK